jgi:hypothetical protein
LIYALKGCFMVYFQYLKSCNSITTNW